jgi:hypothetical protein
LGRLISILVLLAAGVTWSPTAAQAAFGLGEFDVVFSANNGSTTTQAGSHPFAFTISLEMNSDGTEPEGRLRGLFIEEIAGLVADTTAVPQCSAVDFETLDEGMNDCPDATAVGIFEGAVGDPGNRGTAPVFNLVPLPGELMRLGFRVAGVGNTFVDIGLSPEPPYVATATVSDFPEAIELFGAKLQLWGVPADSRHDPLRGRCLGPSGESLGECQVNVDEQPMLTKPTACEGPQATYFEAFSWEGDEDWGSAVTHDESDNPQGFTGCGALAFDPLLTIKPTTEAAGSPTGLDLEIQVHDEGLSNPGGLAQSQVRDLEFVLPPGMTTAASLTEGNPCSEAQLEEETPDADPGAGCPDASRVGAVEAESPMVPAKPIEGSVYKATPFQNFAANAPVALYVVLNSSDLGVVVTQPIGLESDPETGQLIGFADEMPQLPFSDLRIHLQEGLGAPLVSPPLCGNYRIDAAIWPWSDDSPWLIPSSFSVATGPGGGPCVATQPGKPGCGACANSPAQAFPLPIIGHRPHRRRCPHGRHRVQRKGKVRCVKTRQGQSKIHHRHRR